MKARIIITSVGGLVAPNIIRGLKEDASDDIYVVGVDMNKEAVGFHFSDKSYTIASGDSDEYSEQLLDIAKREKIEVIIPGSDEELLNLAKNKEKFTKEGIVVACSDYKTVNIASNKATMLEFLAKRSIATPKFSVPGSIGELETAARALGYPQKPIVFKPQRARGARGFWIVRADLDRNRSFIYSRNRQEITLEWLLESLADNSSFPEILLMEYLPGEDFNVDVLAHQGEALYIIPNQRLVPEAGPVQIGQIKQNSQVQDMAKKIVKEFGFDYWVNVELAYSDGDDAKALIYEINPRISAPIMANKAAGVDLLKLGIKMALGQNIERDLIFRETKMIRYWNELFI